MTDTGAGALHTPGSAPHPADRGRVTGWAGWVAFGGIMMILLGAFQAMEGLVALFNDDFYVVGQAGMVVDLDFTTWGWVHLILGVLAVVVGVGVVAGNTAAQVAGVVIAGLSAIANLAFISAYPVWATIVISIDVVVIYAIVVHGREVRSL